MKWTGHVFTLARRVKNVDDYYEFYEGNIDILYE